MGTRRRFLKAAAAGAAVGGTALLGGLSAPAPAVARNRRQWRMLLAWPENLPGIGSGMKRLAGRIGHLTGGQLTVALLDASTAPEAIYQRISSGEAELALTCAALWRERMPAADWFAALPGGMEPRDLEAWVYFGGGLKFWHRLYADDGLLVFPVGNRGQNLGGWFTHPLQDLADLRGLAMQVSGLAGDVLSELGVSLQSLPPGEWRSALSDGRLEAVEGLGAWTDLTLSLHRLAKHLYAPALQQGGPMLECLIHEASLLQLPRDQQQAVKAALTAENQLLSAQFHANNLQAMAKLKELGVTPQVWPEGMLETYRQIAAGLRADRARRDRQAGEIEASYREFQGWLAR